MAVQLKRIGIFVKDMKKALEFYRMLGLEIPESADEEKHVEVEHNGLRLAVATRESAQVVYGSWEEPSGYRIELAFQCASREAVDVLYRQLTEHGYIGHRGPLDGFWGERYAIVQDPDGNLISLAA